MALIKVVSLFFGFLFIVNPFSTIYAKNNNKNIPFDVKQVIEQVTAQQKPHHTYHRSQNRQYPHRITEKLQGAFVIDTTRFFIPGGYEASPPSITFDGTNYFVVWGDYDRDAIMGARVNQSGEILDKPSIKITTAYGEWEREKPSVAYGDGVYLSVWADYDREIIFGARTSIAGIPLDTIPIPICTTHYYGYQPSIAFGDSNFLVVWFDYSDVIGARVSPAGVVIDSLGIIISAAINDQFEPTVCFGESNYFVAWIDDRNNNFSIYGTRVSTEGIVLDSSGIRISPTTLIGNSNPVVTFGSSNYFIVWEVDEAEIYGARIDQNGTVLDTSGIDICSDYPSWFPSITFDGVNYLAVWGDAEEENLYGRRIDTNGIILDTGRIKICTSEHEMYYPAVIFGGSHSFVVWDDYRDNIDIFGTRVNNEGIVLDSSGIPISYSVNVQVYSKVAFDGTNYFVVWETRTADGQGVYGARVSPTGVILDPTGISIRAPVRLGYLSTQVIFGDSNYFVLWQEYDSSFNLNLYGCRINPEGIILDTSGIAISTEYGTGQPQVVFGGNNYFVVWTDSRAINNDIYGARISSDGVVLDPEGIPISMANDGQYDAQVVFDGMNYFVCWEDRRNGGYENIDIYGARVNTSGTVLDTAGIPISTANNGQEYVSIAFDGSNYLLVWQDDRVVSYNYDIYGARVTQAGFVLDPEGFPISTANDGQYYPRVVFGDNKYFVVWNTYRSGNYDKYGARVTTAGVVLDPEGIPISVEDHQTYSQVVFDGTYYVLVWQKSRSGYSYDIYGARVNPVTAQIDSFVVSNELEYQGQPAIAHGPDNQVFISYTGWTDIYQGKSYYTDRIWGKFAPAPGIEESKVTTDLKSSVFMSSPNPFNRSTTIRYTVKISVDVSIKIFDITGKLVRNLVNESKKPGTYSIGWDGSDDLKQKLPAGVYFYRLNTSNGLSETKELVILK